NSAATVVRRSAMYRRRWAHACGCVPARWAVTVRWAVHQDVRGNRCRREIGPPRPGLAGTSRPRKNSSRSLWPLQQRSCCVLPDRDAWRPLVAQTSVCVNLHLRIPKNRGGSRCGGELSTKKGTILLQNYYTISVNPIYRFDGWWLNPLLSAC